MSRSTKAWTWHGHDDFESGEVGHVGSASGPVEDDEYVLVFDGYGNPVVTTGRGRIGF